VAVDVPLFAAFARDRDSGAAGRIRYSLSLGSSTTSSATETGLFAIDATTGLLSLTSSLDYETSQRHTLVITASDSGEPHFQTNMTVFIEVQDANNHQPIFEQTNYSIVVSESLPTHSQVRNSHFICLLCNVRKGALTKLRRAFLYEDTVR
jgi:protocadherin-16/23